jgi:hypothetical protein
MPKKYRITYELGGEVSAYVLEASSKYNAKQRFYRIFPRAEILKVEVEDESLQS